MHAPSVQKDPYRRGENRTIRRRAERQRDEGLYPEKWGSFSKGLAHDAKGDVKSRSYKSMLRALKTGMETDFTVSVWAGSSRWPIRRRAWRSRWRAAILSRSNFRRLLHSLLRGVPAKPSRPTGWRCFVTCRSANMTATLWPRPRLRISAGFRISADRNRPDRSPQRLCSGAATPGDLVGPYVSQFLLKPFEYGALKIDQTVQTYSPALDYMTEFAAWLAVQNGQATEPLAARTPAFRQQRRGTGSISPRWPGTVGICTCGHILRALFDRMPRAAHATAANALQRRKPVYQEYDAVGFRHVRIGSRQDVDRDGRGAGA